MANGKQEKHKRQLNMDTFSDGLKGKVLEAVSISESNCECRYISWNLRDKTELTISLDTRLTGKLELFDCKTGDHRLVRKIGLLPDDAPSLATERG